MISWKTEYRHIRRVRRRTVRAIGNIKKHYRKNRMEYLIDSLVYGTMIIHVGKDGRLSHVDPCKFYMEQHVSPKLDQNTPTTPRD